MKRDPRPIGWIGWLYRWRAAAGWRRWTRRQTWLSPDWIAERNRAAVDPDPARPVRHLRAYSRR